MEHFTKLVLILSVLVINILAMPRPDAFDDEGEMSVPRSPKIQGPDVVNLQFSSPTEVQNLQCVIEGSPTPTVIWSKDGKEIQGAAEFYNTTYDATDGKAELCFLESAKSDEKYVTGNFTCIAANFLGRAQKTFAVELPEKNATTTASISTSTTENIATISGVTSTIASETSPSFNGTAITSSPTVTDSSSALSSISPTFKVTALVTSQLPSVKPN